MKDTLLSATQVLPTKKSIQDSKVEQPSEDRIRLAAYLRWEQAGCPIGEDERFWLEAEAELQDVI